MVVLTPVHKRVQQVSVSVTADTTAESSAGVRTQLCTGRLL